MYRRYQDIRDRLGEPLWHDDHGVPRYETFHPSLCGVYDEYVALLEIECQSCGDRMLVTDSWTKSEGIRFWLMQGKPEDDTARFNSPQLPTPEDSGNFTYGDMPWHRNGCGGSTMTTDVAQVVEFWKRNAFCEWERQSQYEFKYSLDNDREV